MSEESPETSQPLATEGKHIPPTFEATNFHCPLCGVLSPMRWDRLVAVRPAGNRLVDAARCVCGVCSNSMDGFVTRSSDTSREQVHARIAQPAEMSKMFDMLPQGAREAIERRDGDAP